jgi:hypothetical protein
MALVYKHIRKDNGEIFYVGIGPGVATPGANQDRPYVTDSRNAIWKYIVNETEYTIEIIKDNISRDEAYIIEVQLIKKHGRIDKETGTLANRTDGGKDEWNEYKGWSGNPIPTKYRKFISHKKHELTSANVKHKIDNCEEDGRLAVIRHYKALVRRIKKEHKLLDKWELQEQRILDKIKLEKQLNTPRQYMREKIKERNRIQDERWGKMKVVS